MVKPVSDNLLELHLNVLKEIFKGNSFSEIETKFADQFSELNYIELAKKANVLTFDENNVLIGAYPVSPFKTPFKVTIDTIGTSYCMCAIDSLGIAYTFDKKTSIEAVDKSTGSAITITVDPQTEEVVSEKQYFVTYKDPDKVCNIAQDQCPVINFYSDKQSISVDKDLIILTFDEAVKHAKNIFDQEAFKKSFLEGFKAIKKEDL